MNRAHMKQWIHKLEDGSMKRGCYVLHHQYATGQHRFCCLGVLCEIAGVATTHSDSFGIISYDGQVNFAPDSVISWLELTDQDVKDAKIRRRFGKVYDVGLFQSYLSILNDTQGLSFKQVAKKLRKWFDITD